MSSVGILLVTAEAGGSRWPRVDGKPHGDDVCRGHCWPSAKLGLFGGGGRLGPAAQRAWGRASKFGASMTRLALASWVSAE